MISNNEKKQPSVLFNSNSRWLKIVLVVMFFLAALIRRDEIKAPGFAPTREYNSAIIARAFYFTDNKDIAAWRQEIAAKNKNQQPTVEPPITEFLVSLIYRAVGNEEVWYARYLTNSFWLIGGIFMYKITKILLSDDEALFATAYYLFVPMGIIVSRSFQPEALMMMMYLISLYCIIVYFKEPSFKNLLFSAILTGVTVLIRPLVIFVLYCAFITLSIHRKRKFLEIIDRPLIVFVGISLIIPFAYYGYGIFFADYMRWKVAHSFRPHLFVHWEYWQSWFDSGVEVIGHTAFVAALLGFFFIRKELVWKIIIGLIIGYFLFGLVFNFHIMTHSYYHIQVLPIIGICVASFAVNTLTALKKSMVRYAWAPVIFILLLGLYFSYKEVRNSLYRPVFESPSMAREIGEIIEHSPHTVTDAYEYGLPLTYYGEFSGTWWPERIEEPLYRHPSDKELSVSERLKLLGFSPEYFVITNFERFNRYHDRLKAYLEENCVVLARTDNYLVYTSCQPITAE